MAGKRPAWVDDLEAFLRKVGACASRRRLTLIRVSKFKTYKEAWDKLANWDDFSWFFAQFDPLGQRWDQAPTDKAAEYHVAHKALWKDYIWDRLGPRAYHKKCCALYRRFWPNPPKLPKAKPVKKGR